MKKNLLEKLNGKRNKLVAIALLTAALAVTGCSAEDVSNILNQTVTEQSDTSAVEGNGSSGNAEAAVSGDNSSESAQSGSDSSESYMANGSTTASSSSLIDTSNLFSDRDLEQEADLTDAEYITLTSGEDVTISSEGVYVISGDVTGTSIIVDADAAKVQLVLDGVTITNTTAPAIYVKAADKVFVTTTDSTNTLKVTGTFTADGTTNTDAVIYSKDDLVFNGVGTLNIESTANGISGKDDVKVTGGTYNITADEDGIEANDSLSINDGSFNITAGKDALHSENSDDLTVGYVYINGGDYTLKATDDGIQATTVLMINDGNINVNAAEALEGTYIQINGGTIDIYATDDGINASNKSTAYDVVIEINGGDISIEMASGDTDALDANGSLIINGGNIDITAQFAFDYDTTAEFNGGTITVNGEEVTEITESMPMGGGRGGMGGFGGQAPNGEMPSGEAPDGNFPGGEAPNGEMPSGGFQGGQAPSGEMPSGQAPSGNRQGGFQKGQKQNGNTSASSSNASAQ